MKEWQKVAVDLLIMISYSRVCVARVEFTEYVRDNFYYPEYYPGSV
jgi:hypothetical protein